MARPLQALAATDLIQQLDEADAADMRDIVKDADESLQQAKDKAYALYSMIRDGYDLPLPDYTVAADVVLRDVIARQITVDGNMLIYDWVSPSPIGTCPSWTPDLTDKEEWSRYWLHCWNRASAFGVPEWKARTGSVTVSVDRLTLTATGYDIGRISSLADLPGEGMQTVVDRAWEFAHAVQLVDAEDASLEDDAASPLRHVCDPIDGEIDNLYNLLRDLINVVDVLDPGRRRPELSISGTETNHSEGDQDPPAKDTTPIWNLMTPFGLSQADRAGNYRVDSVTGRCRILSNSTLFRPTRGFLGLTYSRHRVRAGDLVAVLAASGLPHVFRETELGFRMRGSAHVVGVSSGRFVEAMLKTRSDHDIQSFTIV
ncbi:hypothetical protein NKR23_g11338 [Pleurostoma richardsiae]|uniref:Uncharacterized protein n=1 Tax=Pleurostoma richardsiae TaxID=41990 RepID=A0AA38RAG8_9PEZI|nr:hypothetical protein NKR23_g11338 [Pleurostoma richardsiae]